MKKDKRFYRMVIGVAMAILLIAIGIPHLCLAACTEEQLKNWPMPCYQGEELIKLREWEKTWAGKKINRDTIDELKEFLSEEFYTMYKNPQEWGAAELFFTIIPYQQILPTPGQVAATKKYALTAQLDPNPRKAYWKGEVGPNEFLMGWDKGEIAGFPFPFPTSGVEIGWNIEMNSRGDTKFVDRDWVTIHRLTGVEYHAANPDFMLYDYFTGRVDVEPLPNKPKNPKGIRKAIFSSLEGFLDYKGVRTMDLRYLDVKNPEDIWLWAASFRKIRRLGVSSKRDTSEDTSTCLDDEFGWNSHTNIKEWKIVGRKEMLVGRHTDITKHIREKGASVWSGSQLERVNAYVLEVKEKDPDGIYSKEIFYVDPETWRCLQKVAWNRQGKVWRMFF